MNTNVRSSVWVLWRDDDDIEDLLQNEIVLTQEVRAAALRWRKNGALLFGLSDKPDEAIHSYRYIGRTGIPAHSPNANRTLLANS